MPGSLSAHDRIAMCAVVAAGLCWNKSAIRSLSPDINDERQLPGTRRWLGSQLARTAFNAFPVFDRLSLKTPSPWQASQRPPATLQLKRPGWKPRERDSCVAAKSSRIGVKRPA